jgi:bacteriorhodopsin
MAVSGIAFLGLAYRKKRSNRVFHYVTASVVFVASIAYFTMGSNLGFAPIRVGYVRSDPKVAGRFRDVFYVRYIDWAITTPLLLLDLLLTAGMPWPTIMWVIVVDLIMSKYHHTGSLVFRMLIFHPFCSCDRSRWCPD